MTAVKQDVTIEQGGTFTLSVQVLDSGGVNPRTDLTGWSGEIVIRADRNPTSVELASGAVTVDVATGVATAIIPASTTFTLDGANFAGGAQYDMAIDDGGSPAEVIPLAWGTVFFRPTTLSAP